MLRQIPKLHSMQCNAYYAITMFNSNEFAEKTTDHDKTYVLKSPYVEQAQQWGINTKIDHISIGGEAWTLFKWKEKRFLSCEKMKDFTVCSKVDGMVRSLFELHEKHLNKKANSLIIEKNQHFSNHRKGSLPMFQTKNLNIFDASETTIWPHCGMSTSISMHLASMLGGKLNGSYSKPFPSQTDTAVETQFSASNSSLNNEEFLAVMNTASFMEETELYGGDGKL